MVNGCNRRKWRRYLYTSTLIAARKILADKCGDQSVTIGRIRRHERAIYRLSPHVMRAWLPHGSLAGVPDVAVAPTADALLCDEWAERRDDAPRENLEILEPPGLRPVIPHSPWRTEPADIAPAIPCLSTEVVELPEKAFEAFDSLALLGRSAKNAMLTYTGWKLARAGLVGWDGVVTELGARVARHLRNGRRMTLQVKGSSPRLLTFWIDGPSALAVLSFICPYTTSDRSAFGFCPTEWIPRVLLELIGFHPAWDMRFRYTVTRHELLAKLEKYNTEADTTARTTLAKEIAQYIDTKYYNSYITAPYETSASKKTVTGWVTPGNELEFQMITKDLDIS